MIAGDERESSKTKGDPQPMKKLATLMLALTFAFGTVAVMFAQDTSKKENTSKKKSSKKKGSKKKVETPKKDGGK
jgi:hypothetical protein